MIAKAVAPCLLSLLPGKDCHVAWKLHCQPIATSWKPVWRPVEKPVEKLPTQPAENLLSLFKLPTNQCWKPFENQLKTYWNCKCSLLNICWASGNWLNRGTAQMIENWDRPKTEINIGWKPVVNWKPAAITHKSDFSHLQKRQKPSSSLLVLFLVGAIYLSIDQENMMNRSEKEICRKRR